MEEIWDEDKETTALGDLSVDKYLLESVNLDPLNLDEEFKRLPSDLAYWNERYAVAIRQHLRAKLKAEETRAERMLSIKAELEDAGLKKTVAELEALVTADRKVHIAHVACIEAEAEKHAMRCRVDSVSAKRDMLQSYGAKVRAEIMTDPSLRELHVGSKLRG